MREEHVKDAADIACTVKCRYMIIITMQNIEFYILTYQWISSSKYATLIQFSA